MSSLMSGLHSALQSMFAHQQSIKVIEHNVANANTPGYHRQEVRLGTHPATPYPTLYSALGAGQIGNGVSAEMVKRFNLTFYDGRYRAAVAQGKRWESAQKDLSHIEAVLAETTPDGLINKLDAFWDGWQTVESDPTNLTFRSDLIQRASALVEGINRRARDLLDVRRSINQEIIRDVEAVNEIAEKLAGLNGEIANISSMEMQPNDLLDERDRLLDRLAEYSDVSLGIQENGEVLVSIGGHALVIGKETYSLDTNPDPGNDNLAAVTWEGGKTFSAVEGSLTARLDTRDRVIPDLLSGLDDVAAALVSEVNALHQSAYGLDNSTGNDFFSGSDALSIALSGDVSDLRSIAAAGSVNSPGDASIAGQIAALRHQDVLSAGTETFTSYYADQTAALGLEIQQANTRTENTGLITDSLAAQRDSVSAVSLDEEAANLIKSQRAYEAAARMATALDEMLNKIINGMGLVGR